MRTNISFSRNPANYRLYHALTEALIEDENAMDKGVADTVQDHKRKHDNGDDYDDEGPSAGPNQGKQTKRRRTKESESSKNPSSTKETPKGTCTSSIELEYNFQECFNALIDKLDWNNPEGGRYLFDVSKPLPLQGPLGHRTVAVDYFFNNDMEYLKTSDPEVTYTTSIMKIKADRYEIKGIKDMVHLLWSTIKHGVKSVKVVKFHRYGHLEEIVVKRSDQQLYKLKEGNFVDLHLNDIEDMLLFAIQHKLFHLDGSDIVDFIVAFQMFTRSLIIKKRVKDLQLGVESYQKKLNITKPQKTLPKIEFKEPYTPSYNPLGIVYEDLNKQTRVLPADELYKFSDGTLKSVCDGIHHKVLDFCLDYKQRCQRESGRLLIERGQVLRLS
nr:hypothetical protein [Tanacetum cinerariifolium]